MSFLPKLKLKDESPLYLLDCPEDLKHHFGNIEVKDVLPRNKEAQQVLFFALDKKHLDKRLPAIVNTLASDSLLWIAYPKKSGSLQSDLIRDEGWESVWRTGWEGVASISIDSDWSALRLRHKEATKNLKRLAPLEERKTEGIDYIGRTVVLPDDAVTAMTHLAGLEEFFYSMSFTHKKEYVESIVQAKKPETRQKRIAKMIEMVLKLKEQKELKGLKTKKADK
jgi:hypothetical protein